MPYQLLPMFVLEMLTVPLSYVASVTAPSVQYSQTPLFAADDSPPASILYDKPPLETVTVSLLSVDQEEVR